MLTSSSLYPGSMEYHSHKKRTRKRRKKRMMMTKKGMIGTMMMMTMMTIYMIAVNTIMMTIMVTSLTQTMDLTIPFSSQVASVHVTATLLIFIYIPHNVSIITPFHVIIFKLTKNNFSTKSSGRVSVKYWEIRNPKP